ncbi:MAG: response regulator [Leptospiraceae bacterium]|nr:response regulator [Leptospiraceae bacterium]
MNKQSDEKILVIEDDEKIRDSLVDFLELKGYLVVAAKDGMEGVEKANEEYPHLIISDIMMPVMDGYEVYKTLRADFRTATIPFIFLTAKVDNSDIRMGMGLGASDYLCKPFNPKELLDVIRIRIEQSKLALEGMKKLKESLVLSLPHEFFTPLTVILGTVQMLRFTEKKSLTKEIEDGLSSVESSAYRLNNLIDRYIFFSRLEIAKFNKDYYQTFKQDGWISIHSIQNFSEKIAANHHRETDLKFDCEGSLISIPESYMQRVVNELVDNAFKFSKSATNTSITIQGRLPKSKKKKYYTIYIEDHGRGIKNEDVERYSSFFQFERDKYEQQGMGIGIAIAKGILEMYSGSLVISSIMGQGTKIELKMPIANL